MMGRGREPWLATELVSEGCQRERRDGHTAGRAC